MPSPIAAVDLIQSSMQLAGILASGETPTADEINDALAVLNDVIENWTTGTLSVWQTLDQTFPLVAGQGTYTIGTGGDFNTPRPVRIESAFCIVNGAKFPIAIVDKTELDRIATVVGDQSQIQLYMAYVNDMPLGSVILWPTPSAVTTLSLSTATSLAAVATTATTITYPPGGAKALKYTLAVELAGEFGTPVLQTVMDTYRECVADFKRANKRQVTLQFDAAFVSHPAADWRRGY